MCTFTNFRFRQEFRHYQEETDDMIVVSPLQLIELMLLHHFQPAFPQVY